MKVIEIAVNIFYPAARTEWFNNAYAIVEYVRNCLGDEEHPKDNIPTNWCLRIGNDTDKAITLYFIFNEKNEKFASMFKMKYG